MVVGMGNQDASLTFEQRLADFGPELGPFLNTVWTNRGKVDLSVSGAGINTVYSLYAGPSVAAVPYDKNKMKAFADRLKAIAGGRQTWIQNVGYLKTFGDLNAATIAVLGRVLWRTFFHVVSAGSANKRVYVHCSSTDAGLTLMATAVGWMSQLPGFRAIKIVGPGDGNRNDTIVAYLADTAAQTGLVQKFQNVSQSSSGLFAEGLPSLVKKVGRGIGTADEPPEIGVLTDQGKRFSFGSLYATLIWLALKTAPAAPAGGAPDGRHFLDNMLYILRTLQVDPQNPQSFPARSQLEAYQRQYDL